MSIPHVVLFTPCFNRGIAWLDTGTSASLNQASTFVRVVKRESVRRFRFIEEIAFYRKFFDNAQLARLAEKHAISGYADYLCQVAAS